MLGVNDRVAGAKSVGLDGGLSPKSGQHEVSLKASSHLLERFFCSTAVRLKHRTAVRFPYEEIPTACTAV